MRIHWDKKIVITVVRSVLEVRRSIVDAEGNKVLLANRFSTYLA